jgi:hypothetical protein
MAVTDAADGGEPAGADAAAGAGEDAALERDGAAGGAGETGVGALGVPAPTAPAEQPAMSKAATTGSTNQDRDIGISFERDATGSGVASGRSR